MLVATIAWPVISCFVFIASIVHTYSTADKSGHYFIIRVSSVDELILTPRQMANQAISGGFCLGFLITLIYATAMVVACVIYQTTKADRENIR